MTEPTADFNNIPTIGSSQIWIAPNHNQKVFEKPDVAMFDNAPNDVSARSFFGKIFIGLIVWICITWLLFAALAFLGSIAKVNTWQSTTMLKILLAATWFIVQFVGSIALALMYNIFFSKRYYNFGKMFALIFASSILFSSFFAIIYILYEDINQLYTILWFQIIFWLYISLNLMDFLSQPNYSASSMIWNNLWCVMTIVAYIWISRLNFSTWTVENSDELPIFFIALFSVILSYTLMIFWASLWDAIYYKFYEWWNNPFYLPSLNELREERQKEEKEKEEEEEDVNVDMRQ